MTRRPARDRLDRIRQQDLIPDHLFKETEITIIGAGAIGSFSALSLAKMGAENIISYDEDGVNAHNVPNQFYRKQDIGQFKVDALKSILGEFSDSQIVGLKTAYVNQRLRETVIVATDSMASRKIVWEQFKIQPQVHNYIEARMGAKLGMVYIIEKESNGHGKWIIAPKDMKFYEARLYDDDKVKPLPCTGRSIIYNVMMISSLICRAYEAILKKDRHFPRELIFNMTQMDERSWMFSG